MMRRRLKDFFMDRRSNNPVIEILNSEELNLIIRFLSTEEVELREQLATKLMTLTLMNIDPAFPVFNRFFEVEADKLMKMEKGAIYMRNDYRSHYIHSVYTYLLGFFLLQDELLGKNFLNCLNLAYYDTHYREHPVYETRMFPDVDEKKEFQKRWALTTFFHDLAYLSEINLKIMQAESKRITGVKHAYSIAVTDLKAFLTNYFVSMLKTETRMTFSPDYIYSEDLLELLAQRMVNRLGNFTKDHLYNSLREHIVNGLSDGYFDHGLMGAVFMLQQFYSLLYACYIEDDDHTFSHMEKLSINRNMIRLTDAMTAISLHNIKIFKTGIFKKQWNVKIKNHKLPLAFLLILSDELQRWNREMWPLEMKATSPSVRNIKEMEVDKKMFLNHFKSFYRHYAIPSKSENQLVFYVPFWDGKMDSGDNQKSFRLIKTKTRKTFIKSLRRILQNKTLKKGEKKRMIECLKSTIRNKTITIRFERKPLYFVTKLLNKYDKESLEYRIQEKYLSSIEKEAWELFKSNDKTLAQFIELVLAFKKYLKIRLPVKLKNPFTESGLPASSISDEKKCKRKLDIENMEYNREVKTLKCLSENIHPALLSLKKGQDKLSSYIKPHHFHDISPTPAGEKKPGTCMLSLHFPGEEIDEIEEVIKDRLEKKLCSEENYEISSIYAIPPGKGLNKIINEEYLPAIEKYAFLFKNYTVTEAILGAKGGTNGQ